MRAFRWQFVLSCIGLLASIPALAAVELQAPEEIQRLLAPYLPEAGGSPRRLQEELGGILATEGYFSPQFGFSGDGESLMLRLDPGPRTLIGEVDVRIDGAIDESRRQALVAGWSLPVGQPFRQKDWNEAKQQILGELLAYEHPAAQLADSQAEIDAEHRSARLQAHYVTGPRYRFGALRIEGLSRYSPELVERYNRVVRPGQPYDETQLHALQTTLQATPYFGSVDTELDMTATPGADGSIEAPVIVQVREKAAHSVAFGVGASSNTGARIESSYHTPNVMNRAWELDSGLRIEQKKQTAYTDLFLPPDDRNRRHSLGLMGETTDIQGLRTERYAFGVQTVQVRGSVEQRLALNWEHEHREPLDAVATTSRALVPNIQWIVRQVDSRIEPRRGYVAMFQTGGGLHAALSDSDFLRVHGRYQHYFPLGHADTLSLRVEMGKTLASSRQGIPQNYLFRAGGTGSVRGYAYQSLGVREGGAVVGGRYLTVVSAEFTHWLDESWGVAAFADAGDAGDSPRWSKPAVGYGVGVRWRSPAGPIGADLAYGQQTGELQLHFSLAIPF